MNKNVKRLLLYIVLSFAPLWLAMGVIRVMGIRDLYVSDKAGLIYAVGVFGMMTPAVAYLLTRILTKEGWKDSYLLPRFEGNKKYYLASICVTLGQAFAEYLILWRVFLPEYSLSRLFSDSRGIAIILLNVAGSIILFFPAFGEEWGWRGYMMPKLQEMLGKPLAVLVGGIIWGLWHAPLTVNGHNFGVDYPGFPYVGILFMCMFCTLMNAFLTFLTDKTKSIYPAAFAHMINNNVSMGIVASAFMKTEDFEKLSGISNIKMFLVMLPVVGTIGVVSFWLYIKAPRENEKQATIYDEKR